MECDSTPITPLLVPVTSKPKKPKLWFGYLPVWSECVPIDAVSGKVDWPGVWGNVLAGSVVGIRQTLSAVVSATLVFSGVPDVVEMFPFGVSMMWYSTVVGSLWYCVFGRLQYNTNATQEVCAILYGAMANSAAIYLAQAGRADLIKPTVLAIIVTATMLTGVCSVVLGALGIGRIMLRFPTPVTNGFLGTIGFFLVKTAMSITSGVKFQYFYPISSSEFLSVHSLGPVACLLSMVAFSRWAPGLLKRAFPKSAMIARLGNLICQLLPLPCFYVAVWCCGSHLDDLSDGGWTYPSQASGGFTDLWTSYRLQDAEWTVVLHLFPHMLSLVLMSVLCTMTGVVGITGAFPLGPDGDPDPTEVIDFDSELVTVGVACILVGGSNGVVTFHRLGSSIQLRRDGGTHRLAVFVSALFVSIFFFSSMPLGHVIPKWFLGGLFMGSGISFMEGALLSFRGMARGSGLGGKAPSPQYFVTVAVITVAVFSDPFMGLSVGLILTIVLFLTVSAQTPPVRNIAIGSHTVSKTLRPFWELRVMRREGGRIVVLFLQGQLFFGSGHSLGIVVREVTESANQCNFCILSFSQVPSIDASAVERLKTAITRASRQGTRIICCRMNPQVFSMLSAAGIVQAPDEDLQSIQAGCSNLDAPFLTGHPGAQGQHERDGSDGWNVCGLERLVSGYNFNRRQSFYEGGHGLYDAFDMETDALDHCADRLLAEFCYGEQTSEAPLEPYMWAYREACTNGTALPESAFERMKGLPEGTLGRLRPYCEVVNNLHSETALESSVLYFVMRGAVSLVDFATAGSVEHDSVKSFRMKGFSGRGGKRLRKRYPAGNIVGKVTFCANLSNSLIDHDIVPMPVISSKFGPTTEVWALTLEKWKTMPAELQRLVYDMLIRELVDEKQHTYLSGE